MITFKQLKIKIGSTTQKPINEATGYPVNLYTIAWKKARFGRFIGYQNCDGILNNESARRKKMKELKDQNLFPSLIGFENKEKRQEWLRDKKLI